MQSVMGWVQVVDRSGFGTYLAECRVSCHISRMAEGRGGQVPMIADTSLGSEMPPPCVIELDSGHVGKRRICGLHAVGWWWWWLLGGINEMW